MMQVVASWSGGKDSCLAYYRTVKNGFKVSHLLNFVTENGTKSRSHGIDSKLIQRQAEAIGIPVVQVKTSWQTYEQKFKKAIDKLKQKGIKGIVFGDIDVQEHKEWTDRVSSELNVRAIQPLWRYKQRDLLNEFINEGFQAIVVSLRSDLLDKEWLGRKVDKNFLKDLDELDSGINPCGEKGEYHTFVTDGPIFKKKIEILKGKEILRERHWFLEIKKA
ncbi:diphthine--ammonia ligase [Candidatus Aerophobetes bacterium]|uniref:Diphthine--ammonia ligase n=1 Tax=Aerophobetes bacterium TaxID=2030807 RepID=A0A523RWW8_UNCAE|nr:MAG: diphthine--ammonia ligase [Candidatus Aerophobetes bacterium]